MLGVGVADEDVTDGVGAISYSLGSADPINLRCGPRSRAHEHMQDSAAVETV